MSKFGLWWVRWGESAGTYESRMTVGSRKATVEDFIERGFDRIVVLSGEGRGIKYSGSGYGNGYMDGLHFAHWVLSEILGDVKYYITIPFSDKRGNLRDNPTNGFDGSYWRGWIDGILNVYDPRRIGFYWSYESCLQTTSYDEAHVTESFIREMSNYIHNRRLELTWIPTIGNRTINQVENEGLVAIPTLAKYFNHVFVQPHYYQTTKLNDGSDYTFQELVARVEWMKDNGLSIEMEADNSIIGEKSNCAYCKSTQGW